MYGYRGMWSDEVQQKNRKEREAKRRAQWARPEWTNVDVIKFIEIDTENIAEDDTIQNQSVS